MPIAHQTGRRLAVLTGLCVALALGAATHVAAYPVTPDGEPLYLDPRAPQSSTVTPIEFGDLKRELGGNASPRGRSTRCPRPS